MNIWIEIVALVLGPVLAVAFSLWRESERQLRERKLGLMRQLALYRSSPADPQFSAAINLIPIEFGKSDAVMTHYETFREAADRHDVNVQHTNALVKAMLLDLKYSERAATQISRSDYLPVAAINQRQLQEGVLNGIVEISKSSRLSAIAAVKMAEHVTGQPLIAPLEAQPAPPPAK